MKCCSTDFYTGWCMTTTRVNWPQIHLWFSCFLDAFQSLPQPETLLSISKTCQAAAAQQRTGWVLSLSPVLPYFGTLTSETGFSYSGRKFRLSFFFFYNHNCTICGHLTSMNVLNISCILSTFPLLLLCKVCSMWQSSGGRLSVARGNGVIDCPQARWNHVWLRLVSLDQVSIPYAKASRGPCGAENWKLGVVDLNQILYGPEAFDLVLSEHTMGQGLKTTAKASCKYFVDQKIVEVHCKRCCKFSRVQGGEVPRSVLLQETRGTLFRYFIWCLPAFILTFSVLTTDLIHNRPDHSWLSVVTDPHPPVLQPCRVNPSVLCIWLI